MKRLILVLLGVFISLGLTCQNESSASKSKITKQDSLFLISLDSITDNVLDSLLKDYQFFKSYYNSIEQRKEILNLLMIKIKLDECARLNNEGKTVNAQTILDQIIQMDPQRYNITRRINDINKLNNIQDSLFIIKMELFTDSILNSILQDYQFYKSLFKTGEQREEILNLLTIKIKLDECERLFRIGKTSEAQTILDAFRDMVPKNYYTIRRIAEINNSKKTNFWAELVDKYLHALYYLLFIIGVFVMLYFIVWAYKKIRFKFKKYGIEVKSNDYDFYTSLVIESLQNYGKDLRHLSTGLYGIETDKLAIIPVDLNKGSFSVLKNMDEEISFAVSVVNSLFNLSLQGNALSGIISGLIKPKKKVLKISIGKKNDEFLFVNLNLVDKKGNFVNIYTNFGKDDDISDIKNKLNEISFKMLYIIKFDKNNKQDAESANEVRLGIDILKEYANASVKEDGSSNLKLLDDALKHFEKAKQQSPRYTDATIFEGVCLDLQEKHDEAIQNFDSLLSNEKNLKPEIKDRIKYFKAVSHFRKYNYEAIQDAINIVNGIIGDKNPLVSEFIALCYTAKANFIAHKFIHWQKYLYNGDESHKILEVKNRKEKSSGELIKWLDEVNLITKELNLNEKSTEKWDEYLKKQIEWGKLNAIGNAHLTYFYSFLLIKPKMLTKDEFKKEKEIHLKKALQSFQSCEDILKSGVETLTDIGTTYMFLGEFEKCREYCERALKINGSYEYAKYRIVHSYILEGEDLALIKLLEKENWCKENLNIFKFKEICEEYS